MHRIRMLLATVALTVFGLPVLGQSQDVTVLRGQSDQTYKRLVEAERMLGMGKAAEAMESLQRIFDEAGDDLVSADGGVHYRSARQVAQRVLAKLPPDALKAYRDRADEPAKVLLEAGRKTRDSRPLRTLIERYPVSRPAEEALLILGELAFERGDFRTAETYWRRLLPMTPTTAEACFPDPKIDPALIRARVALALVFQGELDAARGEQKLLEKSAPKAVGRLAGIDGPLLDTLQKVLDRPPVFAMDQNGDGEWTTFGGSPSRSGSVSGRLPYYWPSRPTWQVPIVRDDAQLRISKLPRVAPTKSVGFHPVVVDGVAYIADAVRVFGYDPKTGKKVFHYDFRSDEVGARRPSPLRVSFPLPYDADFTLSTSSGQLFARLGDPEMKASVRDENGPLVASPSVLVGFGPPAKPTPTSPPLEKKWILLPPTPTPSSAAWEGAPIAADGRLYAAFARFEGIRVIHSVACYEDPPTKPLWVADLAESRDSAGRFRHELLTLAGGNLIFCTQTGLIVAIDARTAKPIWAMKYPRSTRTIANAPYRDMSPPLADGSRVFVAPTDADHVFALDAETGRLHWKSGPIQVDQMLGVTRGRLVCSIAGPVRGIRGLSTRTGLYQEPEGWAIHDDPLLASFGRGLVSNDLILWPTNSDLFLLNPETGMPLRPPIRGPHGNLAYADGILLVATPTELWGYVSDRVELPRRAVEATLLKDDGDVQRRFAIALADSGRWAEAKKAIAGDPEAVRFKAEWNSDRAERALGAGRVDEAKQLWTEILKGDDPRSWKTRAAARLFKLGKVLFTDPKLYEEVRKILSVPGELAHELVVSKEGWCEPWATGLHHDKNPVPNSAASPFSVWFDFNPIILRSLAAGTTAQATRFDSNRFVVLPNFGNQRGLPGHSRGIFPEVAVQSDGKNLRAYSVSENRVLWSTALPSGVVLTEASIFAENLMVAGPQSIANYDLASGKLLGLFRVPEADPIASDKGLSFPRSLDAIDRRPTLSNFEMDDLRVTAAFGEYHRIRMGFLLDAECPFIDSTGHRRYRPYPLGSVQKYRESPAGERAKIAKLIDELKFEFTNEASLSGQPPIVMSLPKSILVGVRRNIGVELSLLGPKRGTRMWGSRTALLPVESFNPARVDYDDANVYIPAEGRLYAIRLSDGVIVWVTELGADGDWQSWAGRKAIAVYPTQPLAHEPMGVVLRRIARSLWQRPDLSRIPTVLLGFYDSWMNRTLPIRFLDPETGHEVHRLDLDVGPVAVVQFGPEASVVVTNDRIYRLQSP